MENPEIAITLSLKEINIILATLGKHPFDEVAALVSKIRSQGESAIQLFQAESPEEATEEE